MSDQEKSTRTCFSFILFTFGVQMTKTSRQEMNDFFLTFSEI